MVREQRLDVVVLGNVRGVQVAVLGDTVSRDGLEQRVAELVELAARGRHVHLVAHGVVGFDEVHVVDEMRGQ